MLFKSLVLCASATSAMLLVPDVPGLYTRNTTRCKALSRRAVYPGHPNGNTKLVLDRHRINWGTTPPWDALDHLHKPCDITCPSPITVSTQIVHEDDIVDATITFKVDAVAHSKKDLDNYIEMAKAISSGHEDKHTYIVKKKTYHPDKTGCCPPTGCCTCDSGDPATSDQYHQTNRISLVVYDDNNDLHGSLEVQVSVDLNVDADDQECEDLTTIGSACAGAVSGIAGGIFDMISLTC